MEAEIYDLNIADGQRKIFTHYSPLDKTAAINVPSLENMSITPDGTRYLYLVPHVYSTSFVAKGIG
jgi:hypothetical protein